MESVALKARERPSGEWVDAEQRRLGPAGRGGAAALRRPDRARPAAGRPRPGAVRRGPARAAGVRRRRPDRVRGPAAEREGARGAASSRRSTGSAPRCSPPSATTCARRSPGSRPRSARCGRPTSSGPTEERDELLATIEESADRLDAIVANLLDASRLQAGALSVQPEPVALDEVIGAARARRARRRASASRVDVPEDLPLVQADPGLLERVLANLLDNAMRHGGDAARSRSAPSPGELSAQAQGRRPRPGRAQGPSARACSSPSSASTTRHSARRRPGPDRRARVHGGDGRRADRRRVLRRRPDDAPAAAARAMTRVLIVEDEPRRCARRSRSTSAPATTRSPPSATARRRSPRPRATRPTSWSSTSGCPTWTAPR